MDPHFLPSATWEGHGQGSSVNQPLGKLSCLELSHCVLLGSSPSPGVPRFRVGALMQTQASIGSGEVTLASTGPLLIFIFIQIQWRKVSNAIDRTMPSTIYCTPQTSECALVWKQSHRMS